jgi:aminoglycoside phosphotransferase family enzyme
MLDRAIEEETAREAGLVRVAERLARFHEEAPRAGLGADAYRRGLLDGAATSRREIAELHPEAAPRVDEVVRAQETFAERHAALLGARAEGGRVVEGHGDLRPEHVCLTEEPVIIDRLEFCRRLRLLDTASELAFLSLECERLGADWVGAVFRRVHREIGGDDPPAPLLDFYRSLHACIRAGLALGHLRDGAGDAAPWIARAERYVERARECIGRALSARGA